MTVLKSCIVYRPIDINWVANGTLELKLFTGSSKLPANVQQFTCILNRPAFAGSLLDVCWIV